MPELSAILVSAAGGAEVARTFSRLREQTAADRLEVVLVGPDRESLERLAAAGEPLAAVRVVACEQLESTGHAFARGFAASTGELVACSEEHSYPQPGWAEALLSAAEAQPDAVAFGTSLACENPATAVSWAHLLSDFGPAVGSPQGGWADELPGHQTAYRRKVLERLGPDLATWMEIEWILHEELRARGERLWLAPSARLSHLNVSRLRSQLHSEYQAGRSFGALRSQLRGWSAGKRALFVLAAPAVLGLRIVRTGREAARAGAPIPTHRLVAAMLAGLVANVGGQVVGVALGTGHSRQKRLSIEIERYRHLVAAEAGRWEPMPLEELAERSSAV